MSELCFEEVDFLIVENDKFSNDLSKKALRERDEVLLRA